MGEKGIVTEVRGDVVLVKMTRTEACAKCRACTAGLSSQDMLITAKNDCGAQLKDQVNIELASEDFLSAVAISYGLPFVFLVLGFLLGYGAGGFFPFFPQEVTGFLLGLIFMILAFAWIRSKEEHWKRQNYLPTATKIYASQDTTESPFESS